MKTKKMIICRVEFVLIEKVYIFEMPEKTKNADVEQTARRLMAGSAHVASVCRTPMPSLKGEL